MWLCTEEGACCAERRVGLALASRGGWPAWGGGRSGAGAAGEEAEELERAFVGGGSAGHGWFSEEHGVTEVAVRTDGRRCTCGGV